MNKTVYLYEREIEYFGFTPISFVDQVVNSINEKIYQATDRFQTSLMEKCSDLISPEQIEHGMQQLITLLESAVDIYFTVYEEYVLDNILKIPNNIALNHWKKNSNADVSNDCIPNEKLQTLISLKYKNTLLKEIRAKYESANSRLLAIIDRLKSLNPDNANVKVILSKTLAELKSCVVKANSTISKANECLK